MQRLARLARRPISLPGLLRFSRWEIFSRARARGSHSTRFGPRAKSLRRCRSFLPTEVSSLQRKLFVRGVSATRRPVCSHSTRRGRARLQLLPPGRSHNRSRALGFERRALWRVLNAFVTQVETTMSAATRHRLTLRRRRPHSPPGQGVKGINAGVQDAFNLGWDVLLRRYQTERHPVAAMVMAHAAAQTRMLHSAPGRLLRDGLLLPWQNTGSLVWAGDQPPREDHLRAHAAATESIRPRCISYALEHRLSQLPSRPWCAFS